MEAAWGQWSPTWGDPRLPREEVFGKRGGEGRGEKYEREQGVQDGDGSDWEERAERGKRCTAPPEKPPFGERAPRKNFQAH